MTATTTATVAPDPGITAFVVFDPARDYWRVQKVLNLGTFTPLPVPSRQDWEELGHKPAWFLREWVDARVRASDVTVVMVGRDTLGLPLTRLAQERARVQGRPVLGLLVSWLAHVDGTRDVADVRATSAAPDRLEICDLGLATDAPASDQLELLGPRLTRWLRRDVALEARR